MPIPHGLSCTPVSPVITYILSVSASGVIASLSSQVHHSVHIVNSVTLSYHTVTKQNKLLQAVIEPDLYYIIYDSKHDLN